MTDEEYLELISDEKKEIWKRVIYDGEKINYEISSFGNIRRFDNKEKLKPNRNKKMKNCYSFIAIRRNDGSNVHTSIHRLVAMMFVPISDELKKEGYTFNDLTVDHLDGIKYHNVPENLEWVTSAENTLRSSATSKSKNRNTKLTEKDVKQICEYLCLDTPFYDIAEIYGVSENTIASIRYGIIWKKISKKYVFPTNQLSKKSVILICEYLMQGYTSKKISEIMNVKVSTVDHIRRKHTWKDITKNYNFPSVTITEEDAHLICKLLEEGKGTKFIHDNYGYSKSIISHIRSGNRWKDVSKNYNIYSYKYKVKDELVMQVCEMLEKKIPMTEISKITGVSRSFVKDLKYRRARKDITDKYSY